MDDGARPSPISHQLLRALRRGVIGFLRRCARSCVTSGRRWPPSGASPGPCCAASCRCCSPSSSCSRNGAGGRCQDLLGRLANWRPWAAVETVIARLPPYAALVVFVLPSTLLLPLKFLAVFLVAKGQIVLAGLLFLAAKVVATALVARLFLLTQPALMQIGWFARGYDIVMPWKDALVDMVHNSLVWRVARVWKERVRRAVRRQWWQMRPALRLWRRRLVDRRPRRTCPDPACRAGGEAAHRRLFRTLASLRFHRLAMQKLAPCLALGL